MYGIALAISSVLSCMGPVVQGTAVARFSPEPIKASAPVILQSKAERVEIELVEVQVRAIFRIPFEFLTRSAKSKTTASTWRP